jgi:hypothetical protein
MVAAEEEEEEVEVIARHLSPRKDPNMNHCY